MAAVVLDKGRVRDDVIRIQDPDCRGQRVMRAWAPYRRDAKRIMDAPHDAKMGWKQRLDVARDAEPEWVVPVDKAVASLVRINVFYEKVIDRYYLDEQTIWQVAGNLERTAGVIWTHLNAICAHVEERVAYDPR